MIETRGLVKRYGTTTALDRVDLEVPDGAVYGLVGPNGAGKTTLLGLLAGLRKPTEGTIMVGTGESRIGVLPDTPRFDPWLTAREVVDLARSLTTSDGKADRVDEVLAEAGLGDAADRQVGGFSRGMLQRLGVAATVVGDPELLMLDEPSSALDPMGRREVLDLVARLRGRATVLFSSHILGDVQEVSDIVGILNGGRLMYQGSIRDLLVGQATPVYTLRVRTDLDAVGEALGGESWVTGVEVLPPDTLRVAVTGVEYAEQGFPLVLAAARVPVISLAPEAVTLEQVFLELTT
jgi:ABC-2 type transport system ATP-binding protein